MARDFTIQNGDVILYHTYVAELTVDNSCSIPTVSESTASAYVGSISVYENVTNYLPVSQFINGPISIKNSVIPYQISLGNKE